MRNANNNDLVDDDCSVDGPEPPPYRKLDEQGSKKSAVDEKQPCSMETVFQGVEVFSWRDQITLRAIVVSLALGWLFTTLLIKQSLSKGLLNPVNMYAGLVGFSCINTWIMIINRTGLAGQPFTRQETAVIQTCVLAITGVVVSGGFGTYLFAMSRAGAARFAAGKDDKNIKDPHFGWIVLFCILTNLIGICFIVPFRRVLLVDLKLVFPSGSATANLINCIHAPLGTKFARKQVLTFGKYFSLSFAWSLFQWLYTAEPICGFSTFPMFGFAALKKGFKFSFLGTYVGVGMLCPTNTSMSLLVGSVLSWGILWPMIDKKKGEWYPKNANPFSVRSFGGYKVFISASILLADCLFIILKIISRKLCQKFRSHNEDSALPLADPPNCEEKMSSAVDEKIRMQSFLAENLSPKIAWGGFFALIAVSTAVLPLIFKPLKWYHVPAMYALAPFTALSMTYLSGLSDMTLPGIFGKSVMFIYGAWAGASNGGILVGLVASGVMLSFISSSMSLMSDFRSGYITMTSAKSLLVSRVIGTLAGCVISPLVFRFFLKTYADAGLFSSSLPVNFAASYRETAILALEGLSVLPKHCIKLCILCFIISIVINIIRDIMPEKWAQFVPIPTVMAIAAAVGSSLSVDMCIGALVILLWRWKNKAGADAFAPLVAAALICGDGLWTLQDSVGILLGWKPPACAMFIPDEVAKALMETPGPWLRM